MRTARLIWLLLLVLAALGCADTPPATVPRDRFCLTPTDCRAGEMCVQNRCLVPCEEQSLCVGCTDPPDCHAGATQFCREAQAAGAAWVSREAFCADCHQE